MEITLRVCQYCNKGRRVQGPDKYGFWLHSKCLALIHEIIQGEQRPMVLNNVILPEKKPYGEVFNDCSLDECPSEVQAWAHRRAQEKRKAWPSVLVHAAQMRENTKADIGRQIEIINNARMGQKIF